MLFNDKRISNVIKSITSFFVMLVIFAQSGFAELDIYYLDVGQGDAAYIECDGHSMMIDGGNPGDSQFIYSFLKNRTEHLETIVATHPHNDHVGGLSAAFNACTVDTLYTTCTEYEGNKAFSSMLRYANEGGVPVVVPAVGEEFSLGGATVRFLSPMKYYEDLNDQSLIVKIMYGNTSFLFEGDAGFDVEDDMMNSGIDLTANVLKVAHHGSAYSTSADFLAAVSPQYAVISVGKENRYGHPADDTMEFLQYYGTEIYRTDLDGTICCVSDGENLTFITEN